MYLSEELISKKYDNSKIKLKDMLEYVLDKNHSTFLDRNLDTTKMLETVGYLNTFCKINGFKTIAIDHNNVNKSSHCYQMIQNYQSEFLTDNTDLYSEYFPAYKYEFKPEKLNEIKQLILELKNEIENENIDEEDKKEIITIIDEIDVNLKPKTNDIDTINGKILRLHIALNNLGINKVTIKKNLTSIFTFINDTDSFINKVYSISGKICGLIEKASTFF